MLRTASLNSEFTGSYKKKCIAAIMLVFIRSLTSVRFVFISFFVDGVFV